MSEENGRIITDKWMKQDFKSFLTKGVQKVFYGKDGDDLEKCKRLEVD
ncbi:hypothetical protein G210_3515 [Candida maltosa Xu316]|uniref:Uncharacterized protein n=1 Tax=Candida maltosa (strain Xu316) TaxID=1245528 RepID=M3J2Y2_CANMX|nr:hypothetical protein G210_3515 [Candida maltosa Xu316]